MQELMGILHTGNLHTMSHDDMPPHAWFIKISLKLFQSCNFSVLCSRHSFGQIKYLRLIPRRKRAIYIFNSRFLLTASDYRETVSAP